MSCRPHRETTVLEGNPAQGKGTISLKSEGD
jgi:hypothetical protein